jgi:hypothetical protein
MTLDAQIWDSLKRYRSSIPYGCSRYSRGSSGVHSDTLANDGTREPRSARGSAMLIDAVAGLALTGNGRGVVRRFGASPYQLAPARLGHAN